jgi:uncharacterized protein (DUF1684 family)
MVEALNAELPFGGTMTASRLAQFRARKDEFYRTGEQSPLTPEQKAGFRGLPYFDEAPELSFALPVNRDVPGAGEEIGMPTTDGRTKYYTRVGAITFNVNGEPQTLSAFKDANYGRWFIPFTDATTGNETYKGGRYLEPHDRPDGTLTVDFNYAYNPYCAFSEGWSCPIPPEENTLRVRIEAGEKI